MIKLAAAGGESSLPRLSTPIHDRIDSIFVDPERTINVDLSDNGNPADRTPVTLWKKWHGENQVWKLEETN
jgi:hypothetical protein